MTSSPADTRRRRFPTAMQALLLTVCGFGMAFFGCLGGIAAFDHSDVLGYIGIGVFVIGLLAFLFGIGMAVFLMVRAIWRAGRGQKPPPAAAPPPAAQ